MCIESSTLAGVLHILMVHSATYTSLHMGEGGGEEGHYLTTLVLGCVCVFSSMSMVFTHQVPSQSYNLH